MVRFSTKMGPPPSKRLKISPLGDDGPKLKSPFLSGEWSSSPAKRSASSLSDDNASSASFDLDTLDCTVCMEPLSAPIYQCCNGHYACLGCTVKMSNKCPTCSEPTGKIRNLGLEKIIESLRLRCKFSENGCPEILTYGVKKKHEQRCLFAPHICPVADCDFCGPLKDFRVHFTELHNAHTLEFQYDAWLTVSLSLDDPYVVLQAEDKPFLLHNRQESLGNMVYVTSFCNTILEEPYTYRLEVKSGERQLTMVSFVQSPNYCKTDLNSIDFLVIPRHFFPSGGQFQVEVTICRPEESESVLSDFVI